MLVIHEEKRNPIDFGTKLSEVLVDIVKYSYEAENSQQERTSNMYHTVKSTVRSNSFLNTSTAVSETMTK